MERRCLHCRRLLATHAFDPRFKGYCAHCVRVILRHRHPQSAP